MGIPIVEIRRSYDRLISTMVFPILTRRHLFVESGPSTSQELCPLLWRHNGRGGVSNHQPHDCLFNRLFGHGSKKTSKLRVTGLLRGIHRWPANYPHKVPVTRKMIPYDEVIMPWSMLSRVRVWFGNLDFSHIIYHGYYDGVTTLKNFTHYWLFMRGIHRSLVDALTKVQ